MRQVKDLTKDQQITDHSDSPKLNGEVDEIMSKPRFVGVQSLLETSMMLYSSMISLLAMLIIFNFYKAGDHEKFIV